MPTLTRTLCPTCRIVLLSESDGAGRVKYVSSWECLDRDEYYVVWTISCYFPCWQLPCNVPYSCCLFLRFRWTWSLLSERSIAFVYFSVAVLHACSFELRAPIDDTVCHNRPVCCREMVIESFFQFPACAESQLRHGSSMQSMDPINRIVSTASLFLWQPLLAGDCLYGNSMHQQTL
jgi:hypothetical protein